MRVVRDRRLQIGTFHRDLSARHLMGGVDWSTNPGGNGTRVSRHPISSTAVPCAHGEPRVTMGTATNDGRPDRCACCIGVERSLRYPAAAGQT
jgi:hypothetical protein